jgi:hypothetical protein
MDETRTTATLVGTPEMFARQSGAVTATVPKSEIETALTSEPPAELVLEILRNVEGRNEVERRTVNVAWQRADLQSVLDTPDADAITFSFDPDELERALDAPEVEGHGIRETAVVLSIAAAAALAGTSAAAYGQPAVSGHDEMTLAERGIGVQAASHDEATLAERGIGVQAAAATHDEATLAERGIGVAATHDEATLAARGIESGTLAATHDEATLASRGIESGTLAATHDEAGLTARGIETGTQPVTVDTGSGLEFPSVDPGTAAGIAGGLAGAALLIAAATFATRRREPGHV